MEGRHRNMRKTFQGLYYKQVVNNQIKFVIIIGRRNYLFQVRNERDGDTILNLVFREEHDLKTCASLLLLTYICITFQRRQFALVRIRNASVGSSKKASNALPPANYRPSERVNYPILHSTGSNGTPHWLPSVARAMSIPLSSIPHFPAFFNS
jgi:hypothetical protein